MERIKIKGTLVPWLAFFAPAFVVVVAFVASYTGGDKVYKSGVDPWIDFTGHILVGWSLFVYPIYVSLQSALYAGIEHQSKAWAYQCSLPMPKWSIYAGKLITISLWIAISHLALLMFSEAAGLLLGIIKPRYGFQHFSMHRVFAAGSALLFIAGSGMFAIQLLISILFESFLIPASLGLFATMVGAVSRGFVVSNASPYLWPTNLLNGTLEMPDWQYVYLLAGMSTYAIIGCAGAWLFARKPIH
jgi:hypothetical protein